MDCGGVAEELAACLPAGCVASAVRTGVGGHTGNLDLLCGRALDVMARLLGSCAASAVRPCAGGSAGELGLLVGARNEELAAWVLRSCGDEAPHLRYTICA